ncbi:hypothetical protein QJQ45_003092 [Haematococcus lacustris]|nr:hypothetical protein QJQ45_003092 [Haematococcus lacustris]
MRPTGPCAAGVSHSDPAACCSAWSGSGSASIASLPTGRGALPAAAAAAAVSLLLPEQWLAGAGHLDQPAPQPSHTHAGQQRHAAQQAGKPPHKPAHNREGGRSDALPLHPIKAAAAEGQGGQPRGPAAAGEEGPGAASAAAAGLCAAGSVGCEWRAAASGVAAAGAGGAVGAGGGAAAASQDPGLGTGAGGGAAGRAAPAAYAPLPPLPQLAARTRPAHLTAGVAASRPSQRASQGARHPPSPAPCPAQDLLPGPARPGPPPSLEPEGGSAGPGQLGVAPLPLPLPLGAGLAACRLHAPRVLLPPLPGLAQQAGYWVLGGWQGAGGRKRVRG